MKMGQRKLTDYERQLVYEAWYAIGKLSPQVIPEIYQTLSGMRDFGTTDGKPYIEPQPEVGEGYRVATEADKDRADVEFWSGDWTRWCTRADSGTGEPLSEAYHYRVPIDRTPTDDDARQRPMVMVRDSGDTNWIKTTLLAVVEKSPSFVVQSSEGFTTWRYCRFPHPGE
jgi:hypothetical protein